MGDDGEVNVMAWSSAVVNVSPSIRPSSLRDSHVRVCERNCVDRRVSENNGVDMLWHLVVIVPKPPQTPMSFGLDAIPHHPSLTHSEIFTTSCGMSHHASFHCVNGGCNSAASRKTCCVCGSNAIHTVSFGLCIHKPLLSVTPHLSKCT